jgi:hypothetical protein
MARYYHSLGLYHPCTIGAKCVLLIKSGLKKPAGRRRKFTRDMAG